MNGPDSNYFSDYDPVTGRYVESDPLGLAAGINPYAYTEGDPVGRSDPQGLLDDPNGLFTQLAVQVLKRCLIPAGTGTAATVVAIVGGAVALAAPSPTSGCDTVYKPPSCGPDCTKITEEIYDVMNEVSGRINDLLIDKCNQYVLARYAPNKSLPKGCNNTSWQGHITQATGAQNRLYNAIQEAIRMKCPIPPGAWALASRPLRRSPAVVDFDDDNRSIRSIHHAAQCGLVYTLLADFWSRVRRIGARDRARGCAQSDQGTDERCGCLLGR